MKRERGRYLKKRTQYLGFPFNKNNKQNLYIYNIYNIYDLSPIYLFDKSYIYIIFLLLDREVIHLNLKIHN